jgi:DNA-binding response OmpR family regulator
MKKVLIAEDEGVLLNKLRDGFESEGWTVAVAKDGIEAIESVLKYDYDLLLLDLLLPKKAGFDVLLEIKNSPEQRGLHIIALSSLGSDEDIKKALELGANDYFVKTQQTISEVVKKAKMYESRGQ